MITPAKTFLTIAIVGLSAGSFVAWYGDYANPVALTAVLPLGAVSFGLFLIVFALQKEVALYDREQAEKLPESPCNTAAASAKYDARSELPPATVRLDEKAV
jgi:hypothetical protein